MLLWMALASPIAGKDCVVVYFRDTYIVGIGEGVKRVQEKFLLDL